MLRNVTKRLAALALGEYAPYFIYRSCAELAVDDTRSSGPFEVRLLDVALPQIANLPLLRQEAGYCGSESLCFGCFDKERLAGVCFYWYGDRYRQRNFWPLLDHEAKLVQIIVAPEMRGRGVATALIRGSAREMASRGFRNLYARVWHSNRPSLRAFEAAGWRRVAFVLEVNPLRSPRPIRFQRMFRT